jgi:GAF domain-containing protein
MSEAAMTVSFAGRIIFANAQLSALTGRPLEQLIGMYLVELARAEDRPAFNAFLTGSMMGNSRMRALLNGMKGPVPVSLSGTLLTQPDEQSICIVASDLSESEASAATIRREREENTALERQLKQLRFLSRTASRLLESDDLSFDLPTVWGGVLDVLDCEIYLHYETEPGSSSLRLAFHEGLPFETARRLPLIPVERTGASYAEPLRPPGIGAYACFPLMSRGMVLGCVSFGARNRPRFNEAEIDLMQTTVDQAAVALDRARAEEAIVAANADLETRVAQRTAALDQSRDRLRKLTGELVLAEQRERRRLALFSTMTCSRSLPRHDTRQTFSCSRPKLIFDPLLRNWKPSWLTA